MSETFKKSQMSEFLMFLQGVVYQALPLFAKVYHRQVLHTRSLNFNLTSIQH